MIHLKVQAGLCNRLRALNAGIRLAKETGRELEVLWEIAPDMKASFAELFETPRAFVVRDRVFSKFSLRRLVYSKYNPMFFSHDQRESFIRAARKRNIGLYYEDFYDFYPNDNYGWLKPISGIREEINRLRHLAVGKIGVHIRRTDNRKCILNSPTELFIAKMRAELDNDPRVSFFLSTDDDEVRRQLSSLFPEKVFSRQNVVARNAKGGVCDAVIDLWLLSLTKKLYGSYPSSFSAVAAQIGNVSLEYLTIKNPWGEGAYKRSNHD